jgi:hypothetical protein
MDKDRIDLIRQALNGDWTQLSQIRSESSGFFVPMKDLDEATRSKAEDFFAKAGMNGKIDSVLKGVDPQWAAEHPEQMESLRRLATRFELREGNGDGEGKI